MGNGLTGKRFIYWNGFEPRMCLTDPGMIRELLTKYSSSSGKSWLQQQGCKNFIGCGLLMANGDAWHHQRHIVAPAFMGDKLKVFTPYLFFHPNNFKKLSGFGFRLGFQSGFIVTISM